MRGLTRDRELQWKFAALNSTPTHVRAMFAAPVAQPSCTGYSRANYYRSFAYSAFASFNRGRLGSAFFQRFNSGASVSRAFCRSPREA